MNFCDELYEVLDDKRDVVADLLKDFAQRNLPAFKGNNNLRVRFPWNRMFEAEIFF